MLAKLFAKIWIGRSSLLRSEGGNVLMVTGLALPVLLGMAGLAVEGAGWYNTRRAMQNAADAAAIAAASNASSNFQAEARAVARQYGFINGTANTTVTASDAATCPAGGATCYSVTITRKVALIFSKVVGYTGSTTIGSAPAMQLTTTAIATRSVVPREYCILALGDGSGTSAIDFLTNGAPHANLTGCAVASNSSMTCNGHDLNATFGDAAGTNNGCGDTQNSNMPTVPDPYASKAASIPANTCGTSYPGTTWSGAQTLSGTTTVCGTLQLTGDVTLSGSGVIVIRNGDLDLNGYEMVTASGASATLIFSGTNSETISHIIRDTRNGNQGSGLEIEAPTTGTWAGVAIYYDPTLTQNVDMEYGGNEPYFNLTGVVYMPESDVTFSGAINKASDGADCFVFIVETIQINGTANIASRGGCAAAGVNMPTGSVSGRGRLVD